MSQDTIARIDFGTLCWQCENACGDACCWAKSGEPVPGWVAERKDVNASGGGKRVVKSYFVYGCPLYVPDPPTHDPKALDSDACIALLERVIEMAREDYIHIPRARRDIIKWLDGNPVILREFDKAAKEGGRN